MVYSLNERRVPRVWMWTQRERLLLPCAGSQHVPVDVYYARHRASHFESHEFANFCFKTTVAEYCTATVQAAVAVPRACPSTKQPLSAVFRVSRR